MLLTADQQRDIARRANWYFDCYFGAFSEDSVVFNGDGVADLDRLISRLQANAANNHAQRQRFLCDIGFQYSDWRPFDIEDVQAIRQQYVLAYGETNRPDAYATGASVGIPILVK